ncbi:hypothetical protein ACJA3J_14935 [Halobacillus sp. SY10]|uniref:hypothetical protein n=1 Tax=Halobacillus sp. SY10 TaxID=3381356 RepID=UPI0038792D6A
MTDAILSDYAEYLAQIHPIKIKMKSFISSLASKYEAHKEKVHKRIDHYDNYSDERLLKMLKNKSLTSIQDRIAVVYVLKQRGYGTQNN